MSVIEELKEWLQICMAMKWKVNAPIVLKKIDDLNKIKEELEAREGKG